MPQHHPEHLKNQAGDLQQRVPGGDPDAVAAIREFHPRLADVTGDSPALARFALTAAQLVIARQHGFVSWARLRRHVAVVIRPVGSPGELARAFELIGARRATPRRGPRWSLSGTLAIGSSATARAACWASSRTPASRR
jgi:hypothetical protein